MTNRVFIFIENVFKRSGLHFISPIFESKFCQSAILFSVCLDIPPWKIGKRAPHSKKTTHKKGFWQRMTLALHSKYQ